MLLVLANHIWCHNKDKTAIDIPNIFLFNPISSVMMPHLTVIGTCPNFHRSLLTGSLFSIFPIWLLKYTGYWGHSPYSKLTLQKISPISVISITTITKIAHIFFLLILGLSFVYNGYTSSSTFSSYYKLVIFIEKKKCQYMAHTLLRIKTFPFPTSHFHSRLL